MGHLVIEKLLKALYVKCKNEFPPLIHDLRRLCEMANVEFDMERQVMLDSITRFNINARYDDINKVLINFVQINLQPNGLGK